jgi:predicted transcriptional regulator
MMNERIDYKVKVAVIVRALRNAFAINQGELSKASNCARPTIHRLEKISPQSPRSNTLDDIFNVFRDRGVELTINDSEVTIRFTKQALLNIQNDPDISK